MSNVDSGDGTIQQCLHDIKVQQQRNTDALRRIETCLRGSDDHPEAGLQIRVDRLEQSHDRVTRGIWVLITSTIAALAGAVWNLITAR